MPHAHRPGHNPLCAGPGTFMLWPQTLMACPRQGASPCLPAPLVPALPPRGGVLPAGPTTERLLLTRAHRPRAPSPHTDRSCPISRSPKAFCLSPPAQHVCLCCHRPPRPGTTVPVRSGPAPCPLLSTARPPGARPGLQSPLRDAFPLRFCFSHQLPVSAVLPALSRLEGTLLSCPSRDS